MISPYALRLILLSLACFFLLRVTFSLVLHTLVPQCTRIAERLHARAAASWLFAASIAPTALAAGIVLAVCIPSYVLFEPNAPDETIGWLCTLTAALGAMKLGAPALRGVRSLIASTRHVRRCRSLALTSPIPGRTEPVWLLDADAPVLAVVGVLRSKLVVSRAVIDTLSPEQLAAAIRHEDAHLASHDNLKRLILLCAGSMRLEQAWVRFTERAADDAAAAGSLQRRFDLAEALVRFASIPVTPPSPLVTAFASDASDLALRIDRLVGGAGQAGQIPSVRPVAICALLSTLILGAALLSGAPILHTVHQLMELLIG